MMPLNDTLNISLSIDSAKLGLTKLHRSLSDLTNEKLKVKQKEDLVRLCGRLYEEYRTFILDGSCSEDLPFGVLIDTLFEEAVKESSDNESKVGKKGAAGCLKSDGFNLFTRVMKDVIDPSSSQLVEEHEVHVVVMLLKLACHPFAQQQIWMEDAMTELLVKYMSTPRAIADTSANHKQLWNRIWRQFCCSRTRSEGAAGNYLKIAIVLLKNFKKTILSLEGDDVVDRMLTSLFEVLEKKEWHSWNKQLISVLLDLLVCVADEFGVQFQSRLLDWMSTLVMHFIDKLSIDPNEKGALVDSTWCLLDRLTLLAIPDCNPDGPLFHSHIFEIAASTLQVLAKNLVKLSFHRPQFVLPEYKIPLFARIVTICELSPTPQVSLNVSLSQANVFSQHAKRRKESTFFEMLTDWEFNLGSGRMDGSERPALISSCLLILREAVVSFGHRLSVIRLRTIGEAVWRQKKHTSESHYGQMCSLLRSLIDAGAFGDSRKVKEETAGGAADPMQDPRVRIRNMWLYAMAAANSAAAFDDASRLMSRLVVLFRQVIGSDDDVVDGVCLVLSKSSTLSTSLIGLLSVMLTETEFDERRALPAIQEKTRGLEQWRLRCHLAEWILRNPTVDISHILMMLCCYHPFAGKDGRVESDVDVNDSVSTTLQSDVDFFGLSSKHGTFGQSVDNRLSASDKSAALLSTVLIPEVVEYVANLVHDCWFHKEVTSRCTLWQSILRFARRLGNDATRMPAMTALLKSVDDWLSEVGAREPASFLLSLDPSPAVSLLTERSRTNVLSRAEECPQLLARFPDSSVDVPPQCFLSYLSESVRLFRNGTADPSLRLMLSRSVRSFAATADYFPDLLLVLEKAADVIDENTREKVFGRARDVLVEDKESGEMTEVDIQLAGQQLCRAELLLDPSIHKLISSDDVITALPLSDVIRRLPSFLLSPNLCLSLLERASAHPCSLMLLRLSAFILEDSSLWQIHVHVIQAIMQHPSLNKMDLLRDYMPLFPSHFDFHLASMALSTDSNSDENLGGWESLQRTIYSNRSCWQSVVSSIQKGISFDIASFPVAFRLQPKYWAAMTESFWRLYNTNSHHLLTCLRSQVSLHLSLDLSDRLVQLLTALWVALPKISPRMKSPFQTTVSTMLAAIVDHAKRKSTSDRESLWSSLFSLTKQMDSLEAQFLLADAAEDAVAWREMEDDVCKARRQLMLHCYAEVQEFMNTGDVKNVSTYLYRPFYTGLEEKLEETADWIETLQDQGIFPMDRLLFVWDCLPHLRSFISPLFRFFRHASLTHFVRTPPTSDLFLLVLKDFAHLTLSNYRLEDDTAFSVSLRILSCDIYGTASILRAPRQLGTDSLPPSSSSSASLSEQDKLATQLCSSLAQPIAAKPSTDAQLVPLCTVFPLLKYIPVLCHLLAPSVCSIGGSFSHSAAVSLLEFAVDHLAHTDSAPLHRRLCRTVCECIDGVGLHSISSLNCRPEELILLGRAALTAGFHQHAFAVANIAFDRSLGKQRAMVAISGVSGVDAGALPTNRQLTCLLRDIYVATGNAEALDSLPSWAQTDPSVQRLLSISSNRWLRVAADESTTAEQATLASWYCGTQRDALSRETAYMDAILKSKWDQISYPKRLSSHWERLFSSLLLKGNTATLDPYVHMRSLLASSMISSDAVDPDSCRCLHDFHVLEQYRRHGTVPESLSIHQLVLLVSAVFRSLRLLSSETQSIRSEDFARNHAPLILRLNSRLMDLQAFPACLSILSTWQSLVSQSFPSEAILLEKCKVQVAMGDTRLAQYTLDQMIENNVSMDPSLAVQVMCLLATIAADHDNSTQKAIELMNALISSLPAETSRASQTEACSLLHSLSLRHLSHLECLAESPATARRNEAIALWKPQVKEARTRGSSSRDELVRLTLLSRELKCEEEELRRQQMRHANAVVLAVRSGFRLLGFLSPEDVSSAPSRKEKDEVVRVMFPLLDIVFRYKDSKEVVDQMRRYIVTMCPSIWVSAVPHIISHLFSSDAISNIISDMMVKLIIAYPYHVLHTVLAYRFEPENKTNGVGGQVDTVLQRAVRTSPDKDILTKVIVSLKAAHQVYREFVWLKVTSTDHFEEMRLPDGSTRYKMTSAVALLKHVDTLRKVPIPIIEQKMGRAGDYRLSELVLWQDIDPLVAKADGQSAPKILKVKGSDGVTYKTVWKSGEDVRQDSLVEQLFDIMSGLLGSRQPLRTYRVLPLDAKSGIIEFCKDTVSLKDLLIGQNMRGGLHAQMEPEENFRSVREKLATRQKESDYDIAEFQQILKAVTPVFRHHFYREFPTVFEWTKMIDNYTLSLAEWSIVCYVVGLGDRHSSNVLFEQHSSNFVHIDLGMILEFSKRNLPVPEKVPFRLTRDLLDPILIQGTKGVLAHTASAAMLKFRQSKEVILGVASVFMRETLSNFRDCAPSPAGSTARPSYVSAAAISRLRDKLSGTDDGTQAVSVHTQVARLMSEATDCQNLFDLFSGWLAIL